MVYNNLTMCSKPLDTWPLIDNVTLTRLLNYYHSKKLWQIHGVGTIKFGSLFIYHIMLTYIKMKGLISSRFSIPNGISQQLLEFRVMVISIIGLVRKIVVYSSLYCLPVPSEI
jgi:hypothetical protein